MSREVLHGLEQPLASTGLPYVGKCVLSCPESICLNMFASIDLYQGYVEKLMNKAGGTYTTAYWEKDEIYNDSVDYDMQKTEQAIEFLCGDFTLQNEHVTTLIGKTSFFMRLASQCCLWVVGHNMVIIEIHQLFIAYMAKVFIHGNV